MTEHYLSSQDVPNILIVDDIVDNLTILSELLRSEGYRVRPVSDGKLALQAAAKEAFDLVMLDIMMPGMNGYEVCAHFKDNKHLRDIPIIFISSLDDTEDIVKGFNVGGVDYVIKPFQFEVVKSRVKTHLRVHQLQVAIEQQNDLLQELVHQQVKEISDSQMATIIALAKLAEYRDDDTGLHLYRVQKFSKILALKLSVDSPYKDQIDESFVENIFNSSALHDIGKVGIPDNILLKPGKLTSEEFEKIKVHPILGSKTLEAVLNSYPGNRFVKMGISIARSHHEKWNGSGYPDGLSGESIPLCARIMAVSDVYDATRHKRVYKPAFSHEESREIILSNSGKHFDPLVVKAFLDAESEFIDFMKDQGDSREA